MRVLYVDIDTLRADHMGCYGYLRDTTPNLDRIARQAVRFDNCYVSDAPCLPSRASMFTGRFGIHSGVVGHGGSAADMRPIGRDRSFSTMNQRPGLIWSLRTGAGLYPVTFSSFAERHAAWWFYEGWHEVFNCGGRGGEGAEQVGPAALDWIRRNARKDNWLLHFQIWDPHTPYRAPEDFGNPFDGQPIEDWYTEELRQAQWNGFGPGSPQEPAGSMGTPSRHPRQPSTIAGLADYRRWIDGYDCGIAHADAWCGRLLDALADEGVLDELIVLITSDHGENMGELGVIGDHAVADHATSRVPMILRVPNLPGGRHDDALHYQTDVAATLLALCGADVPDHWDGRSLADAFRAGRSEGRDCVVFSQNCWSCMRSVRWDDHLLLRTHHTGLKNLRAKMLFNVADDPHELNDLAEARPDLVDHGLALIEQWTAEMMAGSDCAVDPMWQVMQEGGPFHTRGRLADYCRRLRATGRARHADFLEAHPTGLE